MRRILPSIDQAICRSIGRSVDQGGHVWKAADDQAMEAKSGSNLPCGSEARFTLIAQREHPEELRVLHFNY
jgi:hypothetical protein